MAKQPKIRFKGFTEEWKEKTLGEQLIEINEKNDPKQTDFVISLTVKDGVIPYSEKGAVGNKAKEDHSQYKLAYPNTIVLNSMNILIGAIGICNYFGCVSPIYYVYKGAKDVDLSFVYRFMSTKRFQKNLRKYGNGIMEIRLKVPTEDLMKRIIATPSLKEQGEVSSYFNSLDVLISQREKEVEKLRNIKRVLLEKLFPQKGQVFPSIRFKEFNEKWENRRLKDIATRVTRKNIGLESTLPLCISAQLGLVSQTDYYNNVVVGANMENYFLIKKGEFAYNKSAAAEYPMGAVKCLTSLDKGILSTLYIVFALKQGVDADYVQAHYETKPWQDDVKKRMAVGARNHGLLNISPDDFFDSLVIIPSNSEEQKKVGKILAKLSQVLLLREQQITLLKHYKQALLEQMFIYE